MKEEILQIASDLREGNVTSNEAKSQLLRLFGVINAKRTVCHSCNEDIADYFVPKIEDLSCPECGGQWYTDL